MPPLAIGAAIIGGIAAGVTFATLGIGIIVGAAVFGAAAYVGQMLYDIMTLDIPEFNGSSTYASDVVGNTVSEGVPVARCYGRCKIGCNKVRFNEKGSSDIRVIAAHCLGEVEGIRSWEVNDIDWDELDGAHTKTEYTGTRTQIADGRFTDKASAYRGIAYTAATFKKNDRQIGYNPHVTVVIDGLLCTPVSGGARAFTRNNAAVLLDWYEHVEGYSVPWKQLSDYPYAMREGVAVGYGDNVYAGIGNLGGYSYSSIWYAYNVKTKAWTIKNSFDGGGRESAVAVELNGKIYAGTGYKYNGIFYQDWWEYNPVADTWTQKANYGGGVISRAVAAAANGKIYCGCGYGLATDWWEYDTVADSWAQKTSHPLGFSSGIIGVVNDKIYTGTGDGGADNWYEYNPATDTWTQKTDYPSNAYRRIVSASTATKIFAGSGDGGGINYDWYEYNPVADTWTQKANFSVREKGVAASLSGKIYAGLGELTVELDDWYEYDPTKDPTSFDHPAFRSLEAFCNEVPSGGTLPRYRFDFNFDVNITQNDAKKLMFQAFNGRVIKSQGLLKPVWDSNQMANGIGGLTTKTISHAFTEDNIVKNSLTWKQPERPNTVRIHYIDSGKDYQKTACEIKDEFDIDTNGEILFEEKAWWITEGEIARRRCRFKFNKFLYTDYVCKLSGFSDSSDLELFDLVTVTHSLPGWTAKEFQIIGKGEDMNGIMQFTLEAYFSGVYSDAEVAVQENYSSDLYNPFLETGFATYIKTYDDANVSGAPKIIRFQTQSGGIYYYQKVYPTLSASAGETSDDLGFDVYSLNDTNISGAPKIFELITNSEDVYYTKLYPTISAEVMNVQGLTPTPIILSDADLSGTARIAVVYIGGTPYYFKIYPTRA